MTDITINNPTRWFYAFEFDAEWWQKGGETREECIAAAAMGGQPIWIVEAKRMLPDIDAMHLFDGDNLVEQMQESEVWGEDGWQGDGDTADLERRLTATVKQWFNETCSLDGAQLDFVQGPDRIDPGAANV